MKGIIKLGLKKVGSNGTNRLFFNYINSKKFFFEGLKIFNQIWL